MKRQPYVGLLIGACRRRIKQVVGQRVHCHGLTPPQFWVLMGIFEEPGISLREVAERRRMDDPTASRIVGALLERGLLRMSPNPTDRRRLRLELAPPGLLLAKKLSRIAGEIRRAEVKNFSRTEEAELRRLLLKLMDNLDDLAVAPAGGR